jgi:hypothetical protein
MTQSQQHTLSEREQALVQAVRRSIQIVEQISVPLALEIATELEAALAPLPGAPIDLALVCGGVILPIVEELDTAIQTVIEFNRGKGGTQ